MLVALEKDRNVPFEIRRVYYLFATKNRVHRGQHAHRHLNQLAVTVRGSVTFLLDDGSGPVEVVLDDPSQGLLLGSMVWREMYDFSDDCVLMVLADQLYDPADYITNYDEFLREVNNPMLPARVSHTPPTADAEPLGLRRAAPSVELDVQSSTPSLALSPHRTSDRRPVALATEECEKRGLGDVAACQSR